MLIEGDDYDDVCYAGTLTIYNKDTNNENARYLRDFSLYLGAGTVEELISETIKSAYKTPRLVSVNLCFLPYTYLI